MNPGLFTLSVWLVCPVTNSGPVTLWWKWDLSLIRPKCYKRCETSPRASARYTMGRPHLSTLLQAKQLSLPADKISSQLSERQFQHDFAKTCWFALNCGLQRSQSIIYKSKHANQNGLFSSNVATPALFWTRATGQSDQKQPSRWSGDAAFFGSQPNRIKTLFWTFRCEKSRWSTFFEPPRASLWRESTRWYNIAAWRGIHHRGKGHKQGHKREIKTLFFLFFFQTHFPLLAWWGWWELHI